MSYERYFVCFGGLCLAFLEDEGRLRNVAREETDAFRSPPGCSFLYLVLSVLCHVGGRMLSSVRLFVGRVEALSSWLFVDELRTWPIECRGLTRNLF